jgi:Asp-tRNA(Asn)/Glu-tRNA(Gln) amidotransferase A subunit family amidase
LVKSIRFMSRATLPFLLAEANCMPDLTFLSAISMAEQIRQKKLSPVELVEAHLTKIARLDPQLNAFVQVDSEAALRQARVAEHSVTQGQSLGPLHGVPLSIKSSISVGGGFRCEAGTKLRDNLLYGRTNNPWDLSRTPGGSSGGEAAAIASGCSAGGVGSDGGGSIRVPAHFSGICGLKPTPGRIPATGHYPNSVGPFALLGVVGPMARTVADLKVLFEVMQGPDYGDPSFAPVPVRWPGGDELKKIRVGYFEDDGRTPVTSETRAAVESAAQALRRAGFKVERFRPEGLELARQLWWKFFGIAGGMLLGPMIKGREADLSPILKEFSSWVAAEPTHTGTSLLDTWIQRDVVRTQVFRQMHRYPILLCPVASIPAFRHGERSWKIERQTVKYLDAWSYTEWFNLLGTPAAVVPVAQSAEGLPIGVQISGLPWEEEKVLAVAAALEAECGEWRQPPIH